jgi:Uma2 family endonuclease
VATTEGYAADVQDLQIEPWRPDLETYFRLAELGAFEEVRVELLDGVITPMTPRGPAHDFAIAHLTRIFVEGTSADYDVRAQLSLTLEPGWVPEPDFAIVHRAVRRDRHPQVADFVCEIADSSLRRDRELKGRAYARAGLPEYWIVDLPDRSVEVHTDPGRLGYQTVRRVSAGTLVSVAFPSIALDLDAFWKATLG